MNSPLAAQLIDALAIIGLMVAVWLVASIPILWIKRALEAAGVYQFPGRVADYAKRVGVDGSAIATFFERADVSMVRNGDNASVRVALDERHEELRTRLAMAEQRVREAVGSVQGLAGHTGGTTFLTDLNDLRERTRLVDRLGVEISPEVEDQYAQRHTLTNQLWVVTPLMLVVSLANGALLSVLFLEMTQMPVFGIPLAYILGVVVVALEVGIGLALYHFRKNALMVWLVGFLVIVATTFEGGAMATFSVEFSTSLRDAEVTEATWQDYWMVLLAIVFTPMTSILGYMFEQAKSELAALRGKKRLDEELAQCNRFVDELPTRWGTIDQKARSAEAAIDRLRDAMGGQGDRLAGAIDAIVEERKKLSVAIVGARVEDWDNLATGVSTDARAAAIQNIFFFLGSLIALAAYSTGVAFLVGRATMGQWPIAVPVAIGVVTSFLFMVVGNLAFNRLRLVQGQDGRAQPMSAQPYHKIVAALLLLGCAVGLTWVSIAALGSWGILAGIFLTALGGVLSFLGYGGGRAVRGLVLVGAIAAAFIVGAVAALLSVIRYALVWLLAAVAWLVGFLVALIAKPAELLFAALRRKSPPPAAPEPAQ